MASPLAFGIVRAFGRNHAWSRRVDGDESGGSRRAGDVAREQYVMGGRLSVRGIRAAIRNDPLPFWKDTLDANALPYSIVRREFKRGGTSNKDDARSGCPTTVMTEDLRFEDDAMEEDDEEFFKKRILMLKGDYVEK
ncbi:hypothetical protein EVAR_89658_1 [Eumeta japonica]|uniref:Uncharacterized protein n=1 Tax=Eumeta variegata TaxID=151549 RepID=A0A4C1YCJ6_EUMVA|nr:hypothetical protein EVAR_89658_1 [Eumeta japonica]